MTIRSGMHALLVVIGLLSTSSVHPAAGFTVTGLPVTDVAACFPAGAQTWSFTANWTPLMVDGKPWPNYIVAASGCLANTPATCSGAKCSHRVTCGAKVVKTAVHALATGVVNAKGQGIRTSQAVIGGGWKPPACKK